MTSVTHSMIHKKASPEPLCGVRGYRVPRRKDIPLKRTIADIVKRGRTF